MMTLSKVIAAGNIINTANEQLNELLGAKVKLVLIEPKATLDVQDKLIRSAAEVIEKHTGVSLRSMRSRLQLTTVMDARKITAKVIKSILPTGSDEKIAELLNREVKNIKTLQKSCEDLLLSDKGFRSLYTTVLAEVEGTLV